MSESKRRFVTVSAALLTILVASLVVWSQRRTGIDAAWRRLSFRPFPGRLSGLMYLPYAVEGGLAFELIRLRRSAEQFLRNQGSIDVHGEGVALLLADRPDEAVVALSSCSEVQPSSANCWSDLAAAEMDLAATRAEPRRLAVAFGAADRAVQLAPKMPEALFNRATALEMMHLERPAIVAWERYLGVDAESEWAQEAWQRLGRLRRRTRSEEWVTAKEHLAKAAARDDLANVGRIVAEYPQDARASAELYVLNDWAEAALRGDTAAATSHLDLARDIGHALIDVNGERLLADAVAAIDAATGKRLHDLARAHVKYRKARAEYTDRNIFVAAEPFRESAEEFRSAGSPMHRVADYYVASCETDRGNVSGGLASLETQLVNTPPAYKALRGLLLWQRATAWSRSGRIYEALDSYRQAQALFEQIREEINANYMRTGVIALSAALGRDAEAWRQRMGAYAAVSRIGHPRLLQTILETTARAEATEGRWTVASAFYGLSLEPQLEPPNRALRADASIWRALMTQRLGWVSVARADIARAREMLKELNDPAMQIASRNRLRIAEALISKESDPRTAAALLTEAIDEARHYHQRFAIPEVLLERGRIWRLLGENESAIADFREALAMRRSSEERGSDVEVRNTYFAVDSAAAEELIDLLDRRGDQDALVLAADQNRALSFRLRSASNVEAMARSVPQGTVVAHFTSLRDRLLVISIANGNREVQRVTIGREELSERIRKLTEAIVAGDDEVARGLARALYDVLFGMLGKPLAAAATLVVVPDEVTAAVPFAALIHSDGRFLVETTALVQTPSAEFFTELVRRPKRLPPSIDAVTVGNPEFDRRLWPELSKLEASEHQARDVAGVYPRTLPLIGFDATRQRVVEALANHTVADIACHAIVDPRDPSRSMLLLKHEGNDGGSLYLNDVAKLSLPLHIVVLAACRTSAAAERAPAAMRSFTLAFLAAGTRNAVGTLWEVDDVQARRLSTTLHRHLRDGKSSAEALRLAQVAMIRSNDPAAVAMRSWSGFQLSGIGD